MKLLIIMVFSVITLFSDNLQFKTFQSDFTQHITNPSGNIISYEGSIITDSKNFIWRYTKPVIKEVYILGESVIVNEPELEQTIYTQLNNQLKLATLLQNANKINEHEYITNLNNIEYKLIFKGKILTAISYLDEVENKVSILFTNQLLDEKIDSKIFLFDQNPDFDIIKQ